MIDLDSISSVLDVTIEEIIQKQVFIFTKIIIGGYESRLYIAENFIFVNITIGEDIQYVNLDSISKDLGIMVETIMQTVEGSLSIRRLTTIIYAPCIMDEDSVEGQLDLSYFPIIKEKGVNARYAETYEYVDFYSTVIRDISSGDYDIDHERRNGYRIEFMVNCYMNKLPSEIIKQLSLMFEKSTERTNKYFI